MLRGNLKAIRAKQREWVGEPKRKRESTLWEEDKKARQPRFGWVIKYSRLCKRAGGRGKGAEESEENKHVGSQISIY